MYYINSLHLLQFTHILSKVKEHHGQAHINLNIFSKSLMMRGFSDISLELNSHTINSCLYYLYQHAYDIMCLVIFIMNLYILSWQIIPKEL